MLYVQESVGPDEELIHVGQLDTVYTIRATLMVMLGILGSFIVIFAATLLYKLVGKFPPDMSFLQAIPYLHPYVRMGAFAVFVLGLFSYVQMMAMKATTEIAITDVRLIYKRGIISRHVGEISIDRIEGVTVLQTIVGRFLNYGQIAIRGMGVGEIILPPIHDPVKFRQAVEEAKRQKMRSQKEGM